MWYFIFLLQLRSFSGGDLQGDLTMKHKSSVVGYYRSDLISDNLMEMHGGKREIHYSKKKLVIQYYFNCWLLHAKSWKEGHCVGTIRRMLEIENPVWDFQECLKFSGRLECVCCVVEARMQMQFWRAHIKRVQMPLKQLFNGAWSIKLSFVKIEYFEMNHSSKFGASAIEICALNFDYQHCLHVSIPGILLVYIMWPNYSN